MTVSAQDMRRYRALPLIGTIGALLVLYPVLPDGTAGDGAIGAIVLLLVASGVASLRGHRLHVVLAAILGVVIVGVHITAAAMTRGSSGPFAELVAAATAIPFFLVVAWHSLRYAVQHARLTDDRLLAAASAYLLLGLAGSGVHALISVVDPGSYSIPGEGPVDWGSFVYFSFVTLTTLGYGDVTPRSEAAQAAATVEAIVGVFFLGFLVARMLSLPQEQQAGPSASSKSLVAETEVTV